jgi:hypothetical protein
MKAFNRNGWQFGMNLGSFYHISSMPCCVAEILAVHQGGYRNDFHKQFGNSTQARFGISVAELENSNFIHLKQLRTREKNVVVHSSVVGVSVAKVVNASHDVFIAVIGNKNVTKVWTATGITTDRSVLLFGLQRKSPHRCVVRILQRENETLSSRVGFIAICRVFHSPDS